MPIDPFQAAIALSNAGGRPRSLLRVLQGVGLSAVLGGLVVFGFGTAYRYLFMEKDESGRSLGEMLKNDPFELRVVIWVRLRHKALVVSLIGLALGLLATTVIELAWGH